LSSSRMARSSLLKRAWTYVFIRSM
jgi:hypothetical protein